MKADQITNKQEFEAKCASDIRLAAEVRDTVLAGLDAQEEQAKTEGRAALAQARADREAGMGEAAAQRVAVEAEIELEKQNDQISHDRITDEIREVAEKLLAINAQIQEHLTAFTNL